jgi:hypothetical protein
MQQRTVAAALRMPVDIENRLLRFDDLALQRLESVLFDTTVNQSVELPQVGYAWPMYPPSTFLDRCSFS